MRVLVTGGGGYIGRAVIETLAAAGHTPVVLVHSSRPEFESAVEIVQGDILDPGCLGAAARNVGAVLHLAAIAGERRSFEQPDRFDELNLGGTRNLLRVLDASGSRSDLAPRLVFASTSGVYGAPAAQPICEAARPAPGSPYARSKLAAESEIMRVVEAGGLGACTLRIFNAAGAVNGHADPDDSRIIPRAVAVAAGRIPRMEIYGDGSAVRDFVHVKDIAAAFLAALEHCRPGQYDVFNVGATPASVRDVINSVRRISGRDVNFVTGHADHREVKEISADTRKLRGLGWRADHSTLKEMIGDQWAAECRRTSLVGEHSVAPRAGGLEQGTRR